ncbi:MAG: UDP-glucose 4-epimerase [Marinobacter sp. T13-3]|nr:MAG: UDP-glucose 4-epimerase [Marinobacter sp. T13-3]
MAKGRKVLVTGASGFIGSALCKAMVEQGDCIRAVVRSDPDSPVEGVTYLVRDLEAHGELTELVTGVDVVVHLAGKAHGKGDPDEQSLEAFLATNLLPTQKLAEAALREGVDRFVFLSSIGVHGDQSRGTAISEYSLEQPKTVYAESKLRAERALRDVFRASDTSFVIIRPALVYGDNAPGNFGKLVRLCNSNLPLPLGMAVNRRSLVSVSSLVALIILCIEHAEARDNIFVAADRAPVSTRALVSSLRTGMNRKARLLPIPDLLPRVGLALLRRKALYQQLFGDLVVDATKAERLLGWEHEDDTLNEMHKIGQRAAKY